jgi:uncharacterized membrane protein YfcA
MPGASEIALVLAIGLVAGTVSGIVGFGASIMMMPVLVILFGPQQAVPIMAVVSILVNLSRIAVWWREIAWRPCIAYAATAAPAATLGARTLLELPPHVVEAALGAFFLAVIPVRRALAARNLRITLLQLAMAGALIGYVTGIVASTGPISVPVFLALGLVKGAFLATEAASSLAIYLSKAATFRALGALSSELALTGLIIGSSLMVGSIVARRFVLKLERERFELLMDGLLLLSGLTMLWIARA